MNMFMNVGFTMYINACTVHPCCTHTVKCVCFQLSSAICNLFTSSLHVHYKYALKPNRLCMSACGLCVRVRVCVCVCVCVCVYVNTVHAGQWDTCIWPSLYF